MTQIISENSNKSSSIQNCKISSVIHNSEIKSLLELNGIKTFTKVQVEAIRNRLFFHQNLFICSPSGSGKTLIALLAIANLLLEFSANAIYLVPYKSLAQEKELQFKKFFESRKIGVQAITSDNDEPVSILDSFKIIITTYEKCDALLRMNHPYLQKTRCVIIDEIHELGLSERGGRLEFLLVRLFHTLPIVQVIALSATIGNANELAEWLGMISRPFHLIFSDFRPIPLNYAFIQFSNKIASIRQLCKMIIDENGQIIIFVTTRKKCIKFAQQLQKTIYNLLSEDEKKSLKIISNELKQSHSLAPNLDELINCGIGYHNASLSFSDRTIVENAFKNKFLKILIATTTLAAGINLPARAVILTDIYQYQKYWQISNEDFSHPNARVSPSGKGVVYPINPNMFFQMLGRAGRMGYDEQGDAFILIKNKEDLEFAKNYYFTIKKEINKEKSVQNDTNTKTYTYSLEPKYRPLKSQLNNSELLEELILLLIQNSSGLSEQQIFLYIADTFFAYQNNKNSHELSASSILKSLFITDYTINDFIEKYCQNFDVGDYNSKKNEVNEIKFTKITPNLIEVTLYYPHSRYHIVLSQYSSISCSCQPSYHWRGTQINQLFMENNRQIRPLCIHLIDFLQFIENQGNSTIKTLILNLLNQILKHEYVLSFLKENGFIKQNLHQKGYFISNLGKLTTQLFISPKDMINYQSFIKELKSQNNEDLMIIAIHIYQENKRSSKENIETLIFGWIEEHTMEDILDYHPKIGVGDLFQIKREIERNLKILESISMYLAQYSEIFAEQYMNIAKKYRILALRVKHGVKEDILQLMEAFPKLSRNRGRVLKESGFESVQKILTTNPSRIAKATGIKQITIQKIIEELTGSMKGQKKQNPQTLLSSYINT